HLDAAACTIVRDAASCLRFVYVEDRLPHGTGGAVEDLTEDHFQAELVELSYSANHTLPVGIIGPLLTSSCWTAKSIFQPIRGLDSFWETGLGLVAA
ncbi:MAG: hypothetical protein WBC80_14135, partial [Isosphaeraceae bacterium]